MILLLCILSLVCGDIVLPLQKQPGLSKLPRTYAIDVRIGTPPLAYRLALTSGTNAGVQVFGCIANVSESFADESDIVRLSQRTPLLTHRRQMRSRLNTDCGGERKRSVFTPAQGFDGLFDLHHTSSPLWGAFAGFTLNRNYFHLHDSFYDFDNSIDCLEGLEGSYCEFDATVDKHHVRVALSIDQVGIEVPAWFDINATTLELTAQGSEKQVLRVNLEMIRREQQAELDSQKSWLSGFGSGQDDDDDDSGKYRVENAQMILMQQRLEREKLARLSDPYIKHGTNQNRIVLGSSILLQFQIEKQMTKPISSVRISAAVIREDWLWYEAILFAIALTHLISLVCHSALYHAMFMAGILRKQKRIWWLDLFSVLVILLCFVCSSLLLASNWSVLDVSLRVFLTVMLSANAVVFLYLAPATFFSGKLFHHFQLLFMASGEQLVVQTLLTLSLIIRSDTKTRAFIAVFVAFVAIANAARNVYKCTFLLVDTQLVASKSISFVAVYLVLLIGINLVYATVELSRSVLTVIFGGTIVGSTGGTFALIAIGVSIGTYVTDAYRNAEMIEAKTGKTPDAPVDVGFN
jgi:hypothetical protein